MKPLLQALSLALLIPAAPLAAWESQLLPWNGSQYQEATVNFSGRDWRLLDFGHAGFELSAQPLGQGIPCNLFAVTGSGNITAELQTRVNAAIAAGGGRVIIPAGTFSVDGSIAINGSNVSIEGAGSAQTFINVPSTYNPGEKRYEGLFTFGKALGGWNQGWIDRGAVLADVTSDIAEGSLTVTVSTTVNMAVGDWVVVRQYHWPAFSTAHSNGNWASFNGWPNPTTSANRNFSFTYLRRITAINAGTLTLDAPIPWRLRLADNPIKVQSAIDNDCSGGCAPSSIAPRQRLGVSGLSISFADNNNDNSFTPARAAGSAVYFEGVVDGWVHDLQIRNFPRYGVYLLSAARISIQDSAAYGTQDDGGDGYGYSWHIQHSQNVLVRRSYSEKVRHAYISQGALTSMLVYSRADSAQSRLGDDTHHSMVHANLWDRYRSLYGSGMRGENRGTTSSGAWETLGSGVAWNAYGDGHRGGYDGGNLHYNPLAAGYGLIVGAHGAWEIRDGQQPSGDLMPALAGLQVGPVLQAPAVGSKDRNVLYEGVGQAGLQPESLFEAQLARRLGSLPPDFQTCATPPSKAPFAPSTYSGPDTLILNVDQLDWTASFGSGCGNYHGGNWSAACHAFSPLRNHTPGGTRSARITPTGTNWAIMAHWRGPTMTKADYTALELWVYPEGSGAEFRIQLHQSGYPENTDSNTAAFIVNGLTANTWNQVSIPMAILGTGTFNKFEIRSTANGGGVTVFIDDVVLKGAAVPTATTTASRTPTRTASRTATRSASPTASRTASPTPTLTPSSTRTASPSPTPMPTATWGVEKQVDAFKATAQFYTGFQPGGAGSSVLLAVDSGAGNFVEGGSALRANIAFNAIAGFAELLRGYGTQTLDLSFDPHGLSFWVKGTGGDQVRLMLYEDHDMDGDPYEAGDEVWSSPAQPIPVAWTRIVLPYAAFTRLAGSGNNALDLDRIYGWRLVVDNASSTAHAAQVWFDDLRQLTTRSAAVGNGAILSGSFIQLWNAGAGCECGQWSQVQWNAELQRLKDLCQDTVFVQYGAWEDNAWYQPESQAFLNWANPTLSRIFTAAEGLGMQVVVGLWFGEDWNSNDKALASTYSVPLARSSAVAGEIAALHGASPAFGGWYIPQEVNDLEWPTGSPQVTLLRNFLRDVAAAAKAARSAPVYLAPFFGPNRPADDLQAWWQSTLAVATGIDVLIPQDGVGTTRVDGDVDVPHYFEAIRAAALAQGRSFGATIESFHQTAGWPVDGGAFAAQPASIAQLSARLWEARAAGAGPLVQFEYPYMQPGRGAAYAQLYNDYQAYQQSVAPCATTPTPTRTRTPSPTATPSQTVSTWQVEAEGGLLNGTQIQTSFGGYSGTGYVEGFDTLGDYCEVIFNAPSTGVYQLSLRYQASPGKFNHLMVNGGYQASISFPVSATWAQTAPVLVYLQAGPNQLRIQHDWGYFRLDRFDLQTAVAPTLQTHSSLVGLSPSAQTQALMCWLALQYGNQVITGQTRLADAEWVNTATARYPALAGFDMMDYSPSRVAYGATSTDVEQAIAWHAAGGIVQFQWHWNAPNQLLDTPGQEWWRGFYTSATTYNLATALADTSGQDYQDLIRDLDAIAFQLTRLRDAGVPVLWRPLHEAQGEWFWWGAQGSGPLKQLYQLMFDRFNQMHGLNNLIWVWTTETGSTALDWYPGDAVVDLVGADIYAPNLNYGPLTTSFYALQQLFGASKMIALTENGAIPDPGLMQAQGAHWLYFMTWNGYQNNPAMNSLAHVQAVYNHAYAITRDELPSPVGCPLPATATPTPSASPSRTASPTLSPTPSSTPSATPSRTPSVTLTGTATPSPSPSVTPSRTPDKPYHAGELRTNASYLYGRFETRMRAAEADGVVSSFFTFNDDAFSVPNWNEIDIEILGRYSDRVSFNVITYNQSMHEQHASPVVPDPTLCFHDYAIEWEPGAVRWFIDGVLVASDTGAHIAELTFPQKLMMNLWPPNTPSWSLTLDPGDLKQHAFYDYVAVYDYTPGSGSAGTGNNYSLLWHDDFNAFDAGRWSRATHTFDQNDARFTPSHVQIVDGHMVLSLTLADDAPYLAPTVPMDCGVTHTPSPSATASVTPSATHSATATRTPSSSITPTPGALSLEGSLLYSSDAAGSFHLYRLELATGISQQLSFGAFNDMNPQVSPDGRYAVFYSDRDGDQEIWRLDLDDLSLLQLTFNTASDYDPVYSPDGSRIVFKSNRDDGLGDIFIMNADGSGQVNLTPGRTAVEDWDPIFSADGSQIYFVSRLVGGDPASDEIFVMNADGSGITRLTNNAVPDWYPAPHPSDGRIAFVSKSAPASDDDLFVMDATGGARTQLTFGGGDDGDPAWSADGQRLAYVNSGTGDYDLWLRNADGSAAQALLVAGSVELGPAWVIPPSPTPTPTRTVTPLPSWTASPSPTSTQTVTPLPSWTASPSLTATQTPSATATPSFTFTPEPSTPTVSPTPTATPVAPGPLDILDAVPLPHPNARELRVRLGAPAERVRARYYSPAMVLIAESEQGPVPQGWSSLALPTGLPNGLVYVVLTAWQGQQQSLPRPPLRLYFIP